MKGLNINNEQGFSLVELMIVVGIIGVLATLAVPKFQAFQAKARSAEAKTMLNHIYTLEEAYKLDNNDYVTFGAYGRNSGSTALVACGTPPQGAQDIGFEIKPCGGPVPRYEYQAARANNSEFTAKATTGAVNNNLVCPGSAAHTFSINQDKQIWVEAGTATNTASADTGTGSFGSLCN
ncbi:MAG: hypothetical protein CMP10_14900 [Zetaproteobacteria bacterium]|nr:hypothetical protein [Pseudobdellovibrionaceae bacterium]